jgi:hypothetical protein
MNFNWEIIDTSNNYLPDNNNKIKIIYDNNETWKMLDLSNNNMSIELKYLDFYSVKLSYIDIEMDNNEPLKILKIGNITFSIGSTYFSYPSILFNITKTNNGYKLDLSNLVDLGLENIITKLFIYNILKLDIRYEGNIKTAVLYYYKSDKNILEQEINHKQILDITNINFTKLASNGNIINKNLIFDLVSDNLELYLLEGNWNDLDKIELFINNKIYDKYNLEFIYNKCIIKFNNYINFSQIEDIEIKIIFKNNCFRDLIILNKINNKLQVSSGSSKGFIWLVNGFMNVLIDVNKIIKSNIIDIINDKLSNLGLSELDYNYL